MSIWQNFLDLSDIKTIYIIVLDIILLNYLRR